MERPRVTILVASTNIPFVIELCVRSVFAHATIPFRLAVFDSSPALRPIPMLRALAARGRIRLVEETTRLVPHDEALNRLLEEVDTEYFATIDSDVEILRRGWLEVMLSAIEARGAHMVFADDFPCAPHARGRLVAVVPGYRKFSVWMALYRTEEVKARPEPFRVAVEKIRTDEQGRDIVHYADTGIALYHALRTKGRASAVPELLHGRYFRHYGSASNAAYAKGESLRFRARRKCGIAMIWLKNKLYPFTFSDP